MQASALYQHIAFGVFLVAVSMLITRFMLNHVRILDCPNDRSSHKKSTPKSGGISIVTTFFIGMLVILTIGDKTLIRQHYMLAFIFSSILIATVSLIDDINEKSALLRLGMQLVATLTIISTGIYIDSISVPWQANMSLGWFGIALSIVWILGLTNAFNFMDGIDGLVASSAIIAALFFMIISYYSGSNFVYISGYTIISGCIGFLIYNSPPAKIFMGDVGSVFLGFVFATLAIIAARYDDSHTSFLVVPLLLFHFIFDSLFTFCKRLSLRKNPLQGHRSHLYQIRIRSGHTHLEVTLMLCCMAFLQGLGAMWLVNIEGSQRLFVFVPFLLIQIVYCVLTLKKARKLGVPYSEQG